MFHPIYIANIQYEIKFHPTRSLQKTHMIFQKKKNQNDPAQDFASEICLNKYPWFFPTCNFTFGNTGVEMWLKFLHKVITCVMYHH